MSQGLKGSLGPEDQQGHPEFQGNQGWGNQVSMANLAPRAHLAFQELGNLAYQASQENLGQRVCQEIMARSDFEVNRALGVSQGSPACLVLLVYP